MISQNLSCIACESKLPNFPIFQVNGYYIHRCSKCGLGHTIQNSKFSPEIYYSEEYFNGNREDGYSNYVLSEKVLKFEFQKILNLLTQFAPKNGKLLELGCAYGFFLDLASKKFECTGIEISNHAVEFCRKKGLRVYPGVLNSKILSELESFDVSVMLDCIEHLPDPHNTLHLIGQTMKSGGTLLITTGDWDTLVARLMGKKWRLLTPPQHLYFFNKKSLEILLKKNGFQIMYTSRPYKWVPLGLILYQISRYLKIRIPIPQFFHSITLPINLFDTICIIGKKL